MGKCVVCGKHGLFLKVNELGRCEACANQIEREEIERFNAYYAELVRNFAEINSDIDVCNDPILALDYIPQLKQKIDLCDTVYRSVHDTQFTQRLTQRLMNSITFRDEFHKRHLMGEIKELHISIYADPIKKQFSVDDLYSKIDKSINQCKKSWEKGITSIECNAVYRRMLDAIPAYEISMSDNTHKKLSASDLEESVKYSSITAKSDIDKLGSFIAIDTETTGLSCAKDHLIEVAAVRFEDWTPVEKFETMINPGIHIPADATRVNGITDEMVADAPSFDQIIDSLSDFIGKANIVGHNLPFDLKFIYHYGFDFTSQKRKYYDTCEIAKKTLKPPKMKWDKEYSEYVINDNYPYDVENYKLVTLCDYYGLRDNSFAHRALSDAYSTALLFKQLVGEKTGA